MKFGYVRCNCYVEGKTQPPKNTTFLSVTERKIDWVVPQHEWNKDVKKSYTLENEFADWRLHACDHLDMRRANICISDTDGWNAFVASIEKLGGKNKYPVLVHHITNEGSDKLDSSLAKELLAEVTLLESNTTTEVQQQLVRMDSKEVLATMSLSIPFIVLNGIHAKENLCLGKSGFFITKHFEKKDLVLQRVIFSKTKEMFVSNYFIQETIRYKQYKFTDVSTGSTYEVFEKVFPSDRVGETIPFEVVANTVCIKELYSKMLNAFKSLAEASIETGNSIFFE